MKIRFRILRARNGKLVVTPMGDEFTIPMIDNYADLLQYTLEADIDPERLVVSKGWDDVHK